MFEVTDIYGIMINLLYLKNVEDPYIADMANYCLTRGGNKRNNLTPISLKSRAF